MSMEQLHKNIEKELEGVEAKKAQGKELNDHEQILVFLKEYLWEEINESRQRTKQ